MTALSAPLGARALGVLARRGGLLKNRSGWEPGVQGGGTVLLMWGSAAVELGRFWAGEIREVMDWPRNVEVAMVSSLGIEKGSNLDETNRRL